MKKRSLKQILSQYLPLQKKRRREQKLAREKDFTARIKMALKGGHGKNAKLVAQSRLRHSTRKFPLPSPSTSLLFIASSPFTSGSPPYRWDSINNKPATNGQADLQALAEADSGRISLSLRGGNIGGGFGNNPSPGYVPMRGRWEYGDQTSVSASLLLHQSFNPTGNGLGDLIVSCLVFNPTILIGGALDLLPGLASSEGMGLVSAFGQLTLTATIYLGSKLRGTNSTTLTFLENAAIRTDPNENQFESPGKIIASTWLFGERPDHLVDLTTVVPVIPTGNSDVLFDVVIEVEIELSATRAGVAAPNGGSISMAFQTTGNGLPTLGNLPQLPNPFDLVSIAASITEF